MELELDLTYVLDKYRLAFCEFVIKKLKYIIYKSGEQAKYSNMELYINENKLINWIVGKNNTISIYDLYRLAISNLKINKIDENTFSIELDRNVNIPNSYTLLYPIISLLEYGTLSIRKCGLLTDTFQYIADNLSVLYKQFLMEVSE